MLPKQAYGKPFQVTHTHGTAAVATEAAATGKRHYITDIMVSSDKDGARLLVKQGTTTIWQASLKTAATGQSILSHSFRQPLIGALGATVSVQIDGTTICEANIAGFTL